MCVSKQNAKSTQILWLYENYFCTIATRKSVLWICVKRVGICKSSCFQSVTYFCLSMGNMLISRRI